MEFYSFSSKSNPSFGLEYSTLFDPFRHHGSTFGVAKSTLVLDSERCELVKAPVSPVDRMVGNSKKKKGGILEAKALEALKNHSEAERRRRERINAHLSTLRGLVPCNEKMDKAALLAEVISQVKKLKKDSLECSKRFLIPIDADEVKVEHYGIEDGTISLRASICCEYRPELLSDLKEVLNSLHLKMVKAEMATLGNRVHNMFVLSGCKEGHNDAEAFKLIASNVHRALSSVLDKAADAPEYSPRATMASKRRRISYLDTSNSLS